jgi:hypothetical protein
MGHKFGYYTFDSPKEAALHRTFSFWASNGGIINSQIHSHNALITTLEIQRGISMTSYGEKYTIKFGYNPADAKTYATVEVALSFGYCMQWLKPQGIIKRWAIELGTTPMKLERTIDPFYVRMFSELEYLATPPEMQEPIMFCPSCGKKK